MNIFSKLDRIPEPWSTYLSLLTTLVFGLIFILLFKELTIFAIGFIIGGFLSIILKKAAESSDRDFFKKISNLFNVKQKN
jgi:uncharacterized membrane protein YjjP (DUF1212 family)